MLNYPKQLSELVDKPNPTIMIKKLLPQPAESSNTIPPGLVTGIEQSVLDKLEKLIV